MKGKIKHYLILFIILLFFNGLNIYSQVYFSKRLSFYHPSTWNISFSILPQNNGYVVIGATGDTNNYNWRRVGILKINDQGDELWTKTIGSDFEEYYCGYPGSTKMLSDSSYYFIGSKGCIYDELFYHKGMLIKFNSYWDILWLKDYSDKVMPIDTSTTFYQLDICPDNSIIVSGYEYYFGSVSKTILTKIDNEGNRIWTKRFSNGGINEGRSVIRASDGGYVLGSYRYVPGQPYSADPIIYKTDSLGNVEWSKNLGGPYMDYYPTVNVASDGNIIVATCYADSMSGSDNAYRRINIIKIDNSGIVLWNKKYGESSIYKYVKNINITYDGMFILTGYLWTTSTWNIGWVFKVDNTGDSIWYREYELIHGKYSMNKLNDITNTNDNGYITCGYIYPVLPDTGSQDIWVLKLDSVGCDTPGCDPTIGIISQSKINRAIIEIFPNPAENRFRVAGSMLQVSSCIIEVFDIFGRKVKEIRVPKGQNDVEVDVEGWMKGLYLVRIRDGDGMVGSGKVIVN